MADIRDCFVYFLRPIGEEGPVKIGNARVPEHRLQKYMLWCPLPLEIAAKIKGDMRLERRFHHQFARHYIHHEWFRGAPEITATIRAIAAGAFDVNTLPEVTTPFAPVGRYATEWRARMARGREAA